MLERGLVNVCSEVNVALSLHIGEQTTLCKAWLRFQITGALAETNAVRTVTDNLLSWPIHLAWL